ncbi:TolC family protein [Gloeobacter kilaueensis]|uniref:Outer membrane efflux protein n=1 Tax=Gloeobacter kilaueensis (strain ATCC BAA-2537 / CCAP 1431/1 / ULC 316 / JS1) TaxID=1183438 RepID=U5QP48_GLOK1|nr:TolC family protein [Gloeobacter kilaueensis]AGY59425.1 outer membrane efflux protein [Gloeobacter kilaueensis JS1]
MNHRLLIGLLATGWLFSGAPLVAQTTPSSGTNAAALGETPLQPSIPPMPKGPLELKAQINRPLRLQEAVRIGLERSPQLLLAKLAVERAEGVQREAEAALYPTASFSLSYSYVQSAQTRITLDIFSKPTGIDQVVLGSGAFTPLQANTILAAFARNGSILGGAFPLDSTPIDGRASISWTLFSGGLIPGNIRAAQQQLQAARLDYERVRQDVIESVITAYYDLQTADGNLEIGEAAVKSAQAILTDAQAELRAGIAARFAVLQAEVQLANAIQQRLGYQNQQTVRRRALARLLHFERPTDVSADEPIEASGTWPLGLEESILKSYSQRSELAAQIAQEQAARAREEAAYGSVSPQLSLFANGEALDNLTDRSLGIFTGYSAGVQIQWNAFDGGAAQGRAAQAIADAKSARVRYLDTRDTIRFDVESSYSQLDTSRQQIDTARTALTSAEESLRLARRRFEEGVGTQTDVLVADRDLTQARVNLLTATVDYNRSLSSLRRALGEL